MVVFLKLRQSLNSIPIRLLPCKRNLGREPTRTLSGGQLLLNNPKKDYRCLHNYRQVSSTYFVSSGNSNNIIRWRLAVVVRCVPAHKSLQSHLMCLLPRRILQSSMFTNQDTCGRKTTLAPLAKGTPNRRWMMPTKRTGLGVMLARPGFIGGVLETREIWNLSTSGMFCGL